MYHIRIFLIGLVCTAFLPAARKSNSLPKRQAGVVITLDDKFIDEWISTDSVLAGTNWRATFFVMGFKNIDERRRSLLVQLQAKGHEIGFHGDSHLSALPFIEKNSLGTYLATDFTQVAPMRAYGLKVNSFAYPSGSRNTATDSALLNQFSMLRGVTNKDAAAKSLGCFFNGQQLVDGIGIEYQYKYFSDEYLRTLLDYAREHNTILVVYGHKPVGNPDRTKHEVAWSTLRYICDYVKEHKMKFYTMNDLAGMIGE